MKPYVKGLINKIKLLNKQLDDYQAKCKHVNIKKEDFGSTGNYDPSCNCYWTAYDCLDCGKHWIVELK